MWVWCIQRGGVVDEIGVIIGPSVTQWANLIRRYDRLGTGLRCLLTGNYGWQIATPTDEGEAGPPTMCQSGVAVLITLHGCNANSVYQTVSSLIITTRWWAHNSSSESPPSSDPYLHFPGDPSEEAPVWGGRTVRCSSRGFSIDWGCSFPPVCRFHFLHRGRGRRRPPSTNSI